MVVHPFDGCADDPDFVTKSEFRIVNIDVTGGRGVVGDGPAAGRQEQSRISHHGTHRFVTGAGCAPVGQVLPRPGVLGGVGLIFYGFPKFLAQACWARVNSYIGFSVKRAGGTPGHSIRQSGIY